jgi:hypothetical protein
MTSTPTTQRARPLVDRIADAVLYEGYMLYPYRASSVKNRQRWTFGGLFPRDCDLARIGAEPCSLQAECLVEGALRTTVDVRVRFLHLIQRSSGGQVWQEAQDSEVVAPDTSIATLAAATVRHEFSSPESLTREQVRDSSGGVAGEVVREQASVSGVVDICAQLIRENLFRLTVRVSNTTQPGNTRAGREEFLSLALVSTHAILSVTNGSFVSLMDPPKQYRDAVDACRNVGVWPVLVGETHKKGTMLASPIILYDYPQVAPESPGDLFDATEIDEILTLRILTMTDDEKREMRASDPRADALLTRTEALARDELMRLHGTVRGLRPVGEGETS